MLIGNTNSSTPLTCVESFVQVGTDLAELLLMLFDWVPVVKIVQCSVSTTHWPEQTDHIQTTKGVLRQPPVHYQLTASPPPTHKRVVDSGQHTLVLVLRKTSYCRLHWVMLHMSRDEWAASKDFNCHTDTRSHLQSQRGVSCTSSPFNGSCFLGSGL